MSTHICRKCGQNLNPNDQFCFNCGAAVLSRGDDAAFVRVKPVTPTKEPISPRLIKAVVILLAVVGLIVLLNVNLVFPWQSGNRANRNAMTAYLDENFPGARIVKKEYHLPALMAVQEEDIFTVEFNGVQFRIGSRNGTVSTDTYVERRMFDDIDELIFYGFCIRYADQLNTSAKSIRPSVSCNAPDGGFYDYGGTLELDVQINQRSISEKDWTNSFRTFMRDDFPEITGSKDFEVKLTVHSQSGDWEQFKLVI